MTAVAKLLPCPFCGSQPKSGWQGASVPGMEDCGYWGIDCCNAFSHAGSEQDAAAQWNRRAALSPAELGGVEAVAWMIDAEFVDAGKVRTFSATKPNPDMWGKATFTPLYATTPRAAEAGWLPIESAPKDGSYVLVANQHGAWIAKWHPVYQSGYMPHNSWASMMLNHDHIERPGRFDKPTHWRALTPPKENSDG